MSLGRQWIEGFSRLDGTDLLSFARLEHEWSSSQELIVPIRSVVGASYGINVLGGGPAMKRPGQERGRFLLGGSASETVDQEEQSLKRALRHYGIGRLWKVMGRIGDEDPPRRWARAQAVSMPSMNLTVTDRQFIGVVVDFVRLSDWHAEDITTASLGIGTNTATLEVVNTGDANAGEVIVEVESLAAGGFQNIEIRNATTAESIAVAMTAGAGDILRIDPQRAAIEVSTDGGTTWASAFEGVTLGSTQTGLLTIVPGSNFLEISSAGSPDMQVDVRFYAAYE